LHSSRNTPAGNANFSADIIPLLNDNGVSTAAGDERQAAIDYLNTDDNGVPANYNDARIRETVGYMLGFAQSFEQ
jgi:hypothetical protein